MTPSIAFNGACFAWPYQAGVAAARHYLETRGREERSQARGQETA